MLAYEGDSRATGDQALLNATLLSTTPLSPRHQLLQRHQRRRRPERDRPARRPTSTCSASTSRSRRARASPTARHADRSTVSSTGDRYFPGVVTTADRRVRARLHDEHEAVDEPRRALPGVARRRARVHAAPTQHRPGPGDGTVSSDPIPTGTTFVPGSLEIVDGPSAGAVSPTPPSDDHGEVVPLPPDAGAAGFALRRLGDARATTGGTIAAGATTTVRFRAVTTAAATGTDGAEPGPASCTAPDDRRQPDLLGNETADPGSTVGGRPRGSRRPSSPDPAIAGGSRDLHGHRHQRRSVAGHRRRGHRHPRPRRRPPNSATMTGGSCAHPAARP